MLFYIALNSQLRHIATGSLQVEETMHYKPPGIGKQLPTFQHEAPGPRFKLAASEVGGENSTTTPPSPLLPSSNLSTEYEHPTLQTF